MAKKLKIKPAAKRSQQLSKKAKFLSNLQTGDVVQKIPSSPIGTTVGTILGHERKPGMRVHFEQAECSCNGDNDRCSRCDGTGYYTKEVVDQFIGTPPTPRLNDPLGTRQHSKHESTFSNDQRGGIYGIRESGRYSSNPDHDNHE